MNEGIEAGRDDGGEEPADAVCVAQVGDGSHLIDGERGAGEADPLTAVDLHVEESGGDPAVRGVRGIGDGRDAAGVEPDGEGPAGGEVSGTDVEHRPPRLAFHPVRAIS